MDPKIFNSMQSPTPFKNPDEIGFTWIKILWLIFLSFITLLSTSSINIIAQSNSFNNLYGI